MYVTMNRIPVKPEFAHRFEEAFRTRARLVDRMPGFIRNLVLRPQNPEDPYIVMTFWESEAAFRAWTESPEFREGHARSGTLPKEAFRGPNRLESFVAFLDSESPGQDPTP
ncbi:antibiotic biosynthesis monooxygenase family protein [Thermus altitudinis]|uniref:antibiotic biosynthesis monooxygenase family protein n=1 Tax=Thermus altitudinis TaxID=2908145 RepID=UPI001FAA59AE|nr:antibiotic biosynthesis monooxygenase [Thermus altitudinis]